MAQQDVDNWIDSIVQDVAELPDRSSPDDKPEMMLVTDFELRSIIRERCKYVDWTNAGGPNECEHGYAAGIPCRRCDEALAAKLPAPTPVATGEGTKSWPRPFYVSEQEDSFFIVCDDYAIAEVWGKSEDSRRIAHTLAGIAKPNEKPKGVELSTMECDLHGWSVEGVPCPYCPKQHLQATGEGMETSDIPFPQVGESCGPDPTILAEVKDEIRKLTETAKAEGVALPPRPTGLGFLDGTMIWRQLTAYMDALESRLAAEIAKNAELEKKLDRMSYWLHLHCTEDNCAGDGENCPKSSPSDPEGGAK